MRGLNKEKSWGVKDTVRGWLLALRRGETEVQIGVADATRAAGEDQVHLMAYGAGTGPLALEDEIHDVLQAKTS